MARRTGLYPIERGAPDPRLTPIRTDGDSRFTDSAFDGEPNDRLRDAARLLDALRVIDTLRAAGGLDPSALRDLGQWVERGPKGSPAAGTPFDWRSEFDPALVPPGTSGRLAEDPLAAWNAAAHSSGGQSRGGFGVDRMGLVSAPGGESAGSASNHSPSWKFETLHPTSTQDPRTPAVGTERGADGGTDAGTDAGADAGRGAGPRTEESRSPDAGGSDFGSMSHAERRALINAEGAGWEVENDAANAEGWRDFLVPGYGHYLIPSDEVAYPGFYQRAPDEAAPPDYLGTIARLLAGVPVRWKPAPSEGGRPRVLPPADERVAPGPRVVVGGLADEPTRRFSRPPAGRAMTLDELQRRMWGGHGPRPPVRGSIK